MAKEIQPPRSKRNRGLKRRAKPGSFSEFMGRVKEIGLSKQPLLDKVANAEDEATGQASEVYLILKPLGGIGFERLPREKAWDSRQLAT